jgi:hypothetical protein
MFTYFYNNFGLVNRMHYMKCGVNILGKMYNCGVNSSLLT